MARVVTEKQHENETKLVKNETKSVENETKSKRETSVEDLKNQDIDALMASQATIHNYDPRTMMEFPGNEDEDRNKDIPSNKDGLLNDNSARIGGKRRFMMDALCRALNTDMYVLECDKAWAKNPLGKGSNVAIRFTREFPAIWVLYDNYNLVPDPKIVAFKQKLANEHGYKYIYDTPEYQLNHERLHELLAAQKNVMNPDEMQKQKTNS